MKRTPSLDDLLLFLAIADSGGLAGASRMTGVSVPTLSRRMTELERKFGMHLFSRGARGYALTAAGRELLREAEDLRAVAMRLKSFGGKESKAQVRITAGHWTSRFLANHIRRIWSPDDDWQPVFRASGAVVDIARREADIGIRNHRPDQSWLAGRCTTEINYAVYSTSMEVSGFVATSTPDVETASDRWLRSNHADDIIITTNHARLSLDLAKQGIAQIILPTFAADAYPELKRVSDPISDLRHDEWIICHHEARHDPPIRKALDAITDLLTDRATRSPISSTLGIGA